MCSNLISVSIGIYTSTSHGLRSKHTDPHLRLPKMLFSSLDILALTALGPPSSASNPPGNVRGAEGLEKISISLVQRIGGGKGSADARTHPIRVKLVHYRRQGTYRCHETTLAQFIRLIARSYDLGLSSTYQQHSAPSGREMCIFFCR